MTAPTLVGSQVSTGNVTTRAVTPGSTLAVGTVVFVSAHAGGSTDLSIADAQGNTWTAQAEVEITSGALGTTRTWVCKVTTAITGAITVTRTTSGGLAIIVASLPDTYSGTPADPLTAFDNAATATHATAASTVPDGGGVVLLAATTNTGRTYSASAGTLLEQVASSGTGNPRVGGIAYIDAASAGSNRPILQPSTNNAFAASSVVIVPDAAPPSDVTGTIAQTLPGLTQAATGTVTSPATGAWPAIIGDSLTEREGSTAAPPDREAETTAVFTGLGFPGLLWYGDGGKRMLVADSNGNTTIEVIDAHLATRGGPIDLWVIALGTNDVALSTSDFGDAMRTVIDYINANGGGQILWPYLTYYSEANTNASTFNPVIETVAGEYANVTTLDLNTILHNPHIEGDWLPSDSPHMTVQGYARRDNALAVAALDLTAPATVTGTAAQTLPALTQTAAGTATPPTYTGTITSTLPTLGQSATGTSSPPVFTITGTQTLPAFTQAAAGTFTKPTYNGTVTQTLPSLTQAATGTTTLPAGSGAIAQTLPALTQSATGTVTPPTFTGTAAQTLPSLTQAAAGTFTGLTTITGTIAQTLPAMTQYATGTYTPGVITGVITQTLPALTQSASDTPLRDITVTATLDARRWTATLTPRTATGDVPGRRWTGALT